ncbi:MAG: hypothetical protein BWY89_01396 [Bacteroidetes bacterium ADurb.BinA012]|nr:MAG: hypothetical protein BWY89_01396 [Bacteroidetes bacterium ADurb.BinA012]
MVLTTDEYHLHILAQDFEGCIILQALTWRHVGICRSMEEQYGVTELVSVE